MSSQNSNTVTLKTRLENWMSSNGLDDFSFSEQPPPVDSKARSQGAEDILLVLNIDGRLYELFWGGESPGYRDENDRLRAKFDALVGAHGFRYDFKNHSTIWFMPAKGTPAGR